jgi:hypothetical protein
MKIIPLKIRTSDEGELRISLQNELDSVSTQKDGSTLDTVGGIDKISVEDKNKKTARKTK